MASKSRNSAPHRVRLWRWTPHVKGLCKAHMCSMNDSQGRRQKEREAGRKPRRGQGGTLPASSAQLGSSSLPSFPSSSGPGPLVGSSGDRENCGGGYRVVQEEEEVTTSSPWLRKERPWLCPSAPFPHIRRAGKGDFPEGQGPRREVWHFLQQCPY